MVKMKPNARLAVVVSHTATLSAGLMTASTMTPRKPIAGAAPSPKVYDNSPNRTLPSGLASGVSLSGTAGEHSKPITGRIARLAFIFTGAPDV